MARIRSIVSIPLEGLPEPGLFHSFDGLGRSDHFAVRVGSPSGTPLVRVHSECITGDVFGSQRCDCGAQLRRALREFQRDGGWLIYLRQEGRGIGLAAKLDAYRLQDAGLDTFAANRRLGYREDARDYVDAAAMLKALGVRSLRLLTGNDEKVLALRRLGIDVRDVLSCDGQETDHNRAYLHAKRARNQRVREGSGGLMAVASS